MSRVDNSTVSIVVPVYNSAKTLPACLESLSAIDYSNYEIIIVDDGSTDNTQEMCESYPSIKYVKLTNGGPSRARNKGIELASGEFVAFTDGDCIVNPNWLTELSKGFIESKVAGVGGDQISPEGESQIRFDPEGVSTLNYLITGGRPPFFHSL